MGYFCWKCKTKDHWANEICPKDAGAQVVRNPPTESRGLVTPASEPKAVMEARAFLRKVGRPKVYADRRTQMRELMRKRRATSR